MSQSTISSIVTHIGAFFAGVCTSFLIFRKYYLNKSNISSDTQISECQHLLQIYLRHPVKNVPPMGLYQYTSNGLTNRINLYQITFGINLYQITFGSQNFIPFEPKDTSVQHTLKKLEENVPNVEYQSSQIEFQKDNSAPIAQNNNLLDEQTQNTAILLMAKLKEESTE